MRRNAISDAGARLACYNKPIMRAAAADKSVAGKSATEDYPRGLFNRECQGIIPEQQRRLMPLPTARCISNGG